MVDTIEATADTMQVMEVGEDGLEAVDGEEVQPEGLAEGAAHQLVQEEQELPPDSEEHQEDNS